ncbi:dihydroorotate dehydrogenase [Maritimibacter sp. DP1N21-5]|uniref:dihydroorotate dehydrogenase n=1 Tax=Maritimibacter sp. DP1N21-5 TaxID=2836867 RepID=UPI001C496926|nr:dihydroorotate dehydrogenase [Maritimibacter sp. DP1N21-5]MBV7409230.1 dihydroorotate dehydrogenase [Maritimibacter sp. DP1N21-5]
MTKRELNDDDHLLESYFAAGRTEIPTPSAELLGRIMADAERIAQARQGAAPARAPSRRPFLMALAAAVGGWPAFAGMATAAVAGVWIGAAAPEALSTVTGGLLAPANEVYQIEDLAPGYGALLALDLEAAQ